MRDLHTILVLQVLVCAFVLPVGAAYGQQSFQFDTIQPLLNDDYYTGAANPATGTAAASGLRAATNPTPSNDGTQVAFRGIDLGTTPPTVNLFVADIGDPASWRQVETVNDPTDLNDENDLPFFGNICWTGDDQTLFLDGQIIDVATGAGAGVLSAFLDAPPFLFKFVECAITTVSGNNIGVAVFRDLNGFIGDVLVAGASFLPDGTLDVSQPALIILNLNSELTPNGEGILQLGLSADGNTMAFGVLKQSDTMGVADTAKFYIMSDVQNILFGGDDDANGIANDVVTSLGDPRVTLVRDSTGGPAFLGRFSGNFQRIFYTLDVNDAFRSLDLTTLSLTDFDIVLGNVDRSAIDSANLGVDLRFADATRNVAVTALSDSGVRLFLHEGDFLNPIQLKIFATTLIEQTLVTGDNSVADQTLLVDTDGDGMADTNVTLTTNATETTSQQTVEDSSGTTIDVPTSTIINYPDTVEGATQTISISTPVDPLDFDQVDILLPPEAANVNALPVLRDFGPDGTTFFPPIEVTITYTDAEVRDLVSEDEIVVFIKKNDLSPFEIVPESDIVNRDTVNNTITFKMSDFSQAALGGQMKAIGLPMRPWAAVVLALLLAAFGVRSATRRYTR